MILQTILIFIVSFIAYLQDFTGTSFIGRPLVTGLMLGMVFGDVKSGVMIGAYLEMVWMGMMQIGASIPPDVISGGLLGCAFALKMHSGPNVALTIALPIATIYLLIENSFYVIINPFLNHLADNFVDKGKLKTAANMHILSSLLRPLLSAIVIAGAFYLGSGAVRNVVAIIPKQIMDGMSIATGLLPAVGFAQLLNMTYSKKVAPFFFIGFVLYAYLKLDMIGVAIIGGALGAIMYIILSTVQEGSEQNGDVSDDF
ncbi:PTS mannose/fructose/sorbose/N-acetylgalactosamine transporter subunit IIC [Bombilactobacillus bombi]|uniref:PTS mannose/fructose/sorbose/N-acetylgalactosamine transporter subunit IIC n=1 Tax=Bombilactobacillus bombi TaxID=1303590 RepID=UPI0015E5E1AC|nr:PTS sugar transporter subunit IIC [Bombilactobacillus bombi]MBA1433854.1 PTS sugar transporter subunit IIC [Bombilactobacillus bombi]